MFEGHMTVGDLSRRTGMTAKLIRRLTDRGLIYSPGRSAANYRLYDESAVWCIEVISRLRELGLTLDNIQRLGDVYVNQPDADIRPVFEAVLGNARARLESRISHLTDVLARQEAVLGGDDRSAGSLPSDPTRA